MSTPERDGKTALQDGALLNVDELRVRRGGRDILKGVSLTVHPGEIVGFLGPNGTGKSTSINAIVGLLPIAGGEVTLFGVPGQADARALVRIGLEPENGGFYEWMSAQAYLSYFARLYGVDDHEGRAAELLERVRLRPAPGQPIRAFSTGMKQRLGLARALVAKPRLLILDEPTSGLDPRGRRDVHDILLDLSSEGVGILLCTHILDDVERLCQAISIIADGRTVASGNLDDLLSGAETGDRFELVLAKDVDPDVVRTASAGEATVEGGDGRRLFLRLAAGIEPARFWARLIGAGIMIEEARRIGSGLEDFYLTVTETQPQEIAA